MTSAELNALSLLEHNELFKFHRPQYKRIIVSPGIACEPNEYKSLIGKKVTVKDRTKTVFPGTGTSVRYEYKFDPVAEGELLGVYVNLFGDFLGCHVRTESGQVLLGPTPFSKPHSWEEVLSLIGGNSHYR